ncbi:MAG: ATP-binding protein [Bacteroidia bacterium]|nr:ATP-binding protein [Bacteroidia bacterium]
MRKFIKDLFNVDWEDLTFERVAQFFSITRQESQYLESKSYKSFSSQIDEIVWSMVGMLNSEGGVVVYGGPKQVRNKSEDLETQLNPVTEVLDERNLLQKFISKIEPYPSGIELRFLGKPGAVILLILIQRTESKPFMVKDRGYPYRIDTKTSIAPHHYIEALMRKQTFPTIILEVTECVFQHTILTSNLQDVSLRVTSVIKNLSLMTEFNLNLRVVIVDDTFKRQIYNPVSRKRLQGGRIDYHILTFSAQLSSDNYKKGGIAFLYFGVDGDTLPLKCSKYTLRWQVGKEVDVIRDFENKFAIDLSEDERIEVSMQLALIEMPN